MTQRNDKPIIELPLAEKRPRGRPRKEDALTPAERAKRYRAKQKALQVAPGRSADRDENSVTKKKVAELLEKLIKLQMKCDQQHSLNLQLQTELATVRQQAAAKKRAANPLANEIAKLRQTIADQDKVISGYSAEINRLRDELGSSRKKI